MLGHQPSGLDSGLLADVQVAMGCDDLDKGKERLGMSIEVFFEFGSDGTEPLGVSWLKPWVSTEEIQMVRLLGIMEERTSLRLLEESGQLLLIHDSEIMG